MSDDDEELTVPIDDFGPEELEAIERNEAGLRPLSPEEVADITDNGVWPVHPDPSVVVVRAMHRLGDRLVVRWYRPRT